MKKCSVVIDAWSGGDANFVRCVVLQLGDVLI
jgi:hypothetical protein